MLFIDWTDIGTIGILILIVVLVVVVLVLGLKWGIQAVKGKDNGFGNVFLTGLILVGISVVIDVIFYFVLSAYTWVGTIISFILWLVIIVKRHETTYLGAFGALIIAFILIIILMVILFLVAGTVLVGLLTLLGL